ncbi:cation diffusion facilitator family transporter [Caproicibacterium amylolyticum]|uniref:Cation transporter n=1 Tax=Caproicibacterium amylolyticum TaxID=2766537 RepID=A0A7G9WIZ2_9FIRM|nr:cation diffusion facilitator family transporter [Caproicibacterium amylolyticum]QNO18654.1 cation transporter [Caproicibacterium amylolyticum]
MTEFLVRRFVREYQDTENPKVRAAYGRFSGTVGIVTNVLLAAFKFLAGTLSGSLAVTADAVNNLSDSASSIVTLVGFKLAEKPADEEHPFGHERIEYLSGLIVSFVILVVGLQLVQEAVSKIMEPTAPEINAVTIIVLILSILAKLWQSLFYRNIGRRIESGTLFATAADSRNDVIATSVILLGMIITTTTGFNLDGFMGLAVAILIIVTGIKLIKETSDPLLGQAPDKEMVDKIYDAVKAHDGILGAHDLTVHNYGPDRWFASVHCEVDAHQDVLVSHDLIDNIERTVGPQLGIQLVIHMDPVITDDPKTNELNRQVNDMVRAVEPRATVHDFRVVWGPTHSNLIFDVCVPFSCKLTNEELNSRIKMGVKALGENYYSVVTVDRDYVSEDFAGTQNQ